MQRTFVFAIDALFIHGSEIDHGCLITISTTTKASIAAYSISRPSKPMNSMMDLLLQ